MSHFQQHQEFYDKPIKLSAEEKNDPLKVIDEFFTDYNLSEIRKINHDVDRVCLSSDTPPFQDPEERDLLISYRESEEKVLEAASLLLENQKPELVPTKPLRSAKALKCPEGALDLDDLQNRVFDIQLKVAEICQIVVKAWGEKIKLLVP
jgi:hypothetical protein